MNTSTKALRESAAGYKDEAMGTAAQALDTTREYAREYAGRAADVGREKMRDLRAGAREMAGRGYESVSSAAAAAQRQAAEYARATQRYVADEPVKSALIAAAIGAAVAGLVIALRRNRREY